MSYAIAPTFEANKIGVRRAYTLGMFRGMDGAPSALALQMIADGYDISTITTLADNNVTDAQLQYLYDNFGAGTQEFAAAANAILQSLTSASGGGVSPGTTPIGMQTSAAGAAYGAAASIIQNPFGPALDLTQEASWNTISGYFTMVQQQLNSIVQAQGGKPDADTINQISNFNQLVAKWANYYAQAFGSVPPSLPYASATGLSGTLGVIPVAVIVGIGVAGLVTLIATLYGIYTWGQTKQAQIKATTQVQTTTITGAQTSANTLLQQANALLAQANALPPAQSAQAAQIRAQAAAMQTQAAALLGQTVSSTTPLPGATSALTTWFTQNWIGVAAVILGIAVLPGLVKKL